MNSEGKNGLVSVVVPVLNEEKSLEELYRQIAAAFISTDLTFEIIFVDDGSTDRSFEIESKIAGVNPNVSIIRFQRNFGKAAALTEGFRMASGEFIATLDADLQDDPNEIPAMIGQMNGGYDLVSGWKKKRNDPITKTFPSKIFNRVTSWMTGAKIHDFNCGLKVYRHEVVQSLKIYGGLYRYIPALAHLSGFRVGEKVVQHRARKFGVSKYGGSRLYHGFWDLITVLFLSKYERRPLHLFGLPGIICFLIGFVISLVLTIRWFMGHWIGNRPVFFLGILLLIVGLQFISMGLLGEMIAFGQKKENTIIKSVSLPDSTKENACL
ncbi:MAG: glycosyltransferase family 2 protein [Candidatus Marinimicrobia bacterium]|nr:glycosyltransferase family 2 protein [Candidatus Neomarinimicrobiota bacterium]